MIRSATADDLSAVLGMVKELHASTRMALPVNDMVTMRTLQSLLSGEGGLLLVCGSDGVLTGFIAATVSYTAISAAPVAAELGWWAAPGSRAGARLLLRYEKWARERGCHFIRMSTPPHNDRAAQILEKRGFFVSELAWAKAI